MAHWAVAFLRWVPFELLLKKDNDLVPVLFLTLGLFRIVAEDISPSAFTVTNDNLLCMEVILDDGVSTACGKDLAFDLSDTCHAGF